MNTDLLRLNLRASVAMGRLAELNMTVEQMSCVSAIIEALSACLTEIRALHEPPMVRGQYPH